ncbi:Delta(8)-fatty-acid desaturase 2 [Striga hermonthica]|uniref:Delta(8)-fatty-acid desaturase 2 n=1 Tax=Striga hermonthica TaxID=68872 RepID=A0A9N7NF54_STRHE|nr:Delta(8)-fatty-acid desaturase 2 [Striga hermonthica]
MQTSEVKLIIGEAPPVMFSLSGLQLVPDRAINILGILVIWTWFPLLVACLPNWTERVLFVLASFTVCSIQHVQFCVNHFAADVYVGSPKGNDWLPRCHLRSVLPVVQELCKKHNSPYNSLSFYEANKWTLRSAALEAMDFSPPVPKNLLWEAVNTQG